MSLSSRFKPFLHVLAFPLAVLFGHTVAALLHVYYIWPWFDRPEHFLGGASIAVSSYLFIAYLVHTAYIAKPPKLVWFAVSIAFVALAATIWEIMEFTSDYYLGTVNQPGLFDTMKDMMLGMMGGVAGALGMNIVKHKEIGR